MHAMILHFQSIAPTWLLLHYDWAANQHAPPFLKRCSTIVVIGRVKWIDGSKFTGLENYAWFRFAADHRGAPAIYNDRCRPSRKPTGQRELFDAQD